MRAWLALAPVAAAGVLVAHALAYRLTGTPDAPLHAYLAHAPQLLVVLALVGWGAAALASRLRRPPLWAFPVAAVALFVVQEHVERLVHTGRPPLLLAAPEFLLGLLLQLPVAALVAVLARWLLAALVPAPPRRPPAQRWLALPVRLPAGVHLCATVGPPLPGRGPPFLAAS